MGPGLSPARARPGARVFSRARGPTFREGLKHGPGPVVKSPGALKGSKNMHFLEKNVLFLDFKIKNVDIKDANYLGILSYIDISWVFYYFCLFFIYFDPLQEYQL